MFDIGFSEMILLGLIALIAIGPKQLPEVARTVARLINEVRRVTNDFTQQFMSVRESTTSFLHNTQEEINRSLDGSSANGTNGLAPHETSNSYPPLDTPEPGTEMAPHPPYEPVDGGEQLSLALDPAAAPITPVDPRKDPGSNG